MAPRVQLTVPTTESLPHSFRLPATHREVVRTISKLSRKSLIDLALFWIRKKNRQFAPAYLAADHHEETEDADAAYEPAADYDELHDIYKGFASRRGGKKDIVDRILEGDWRSGISLFQLATAEIQHLVDHPTTLRWNAKRIAKIENSQARYKDLEVTNSSEHLPRFHGNTFLFNLRREVSSLMKAHYYLGRVDGWPITLLRVYVHDSPYTTESSLKNVPDTSPSDASKAVFFVFPDGSPYVYVSLSTHFGQTVGEEARQLRDILIQAIPKALSRASNRYELQNTNLSARDLNTLLKFRGPGRTNAAGGGWSIFAENSFSQNALDYAATARPRENESKPKDADQAVKDAEKGEPKPLPTHKGPPGKRKTPALEAPSSKRQKEEAEGRFGVSGKAGDNAALERFEVRIDDPFPSASIQPAVRQVADGTAAAAAAEQGGNPDGSTTNIANVQVNKRRRGNRPSDLDRSLEDLEAHLPEEGAQGPETWIPDVRVTFQGNHVFAGIRQLVEAGVVDGEKMPGWMSGEAGVSVGAIRNGRIKTKGGVPGV